jgi:uncharacterized protein (TIGR03435 family)
MAESVEFARRVLAAGCVAMAAYALAPGHGVRALAAQNAGSEPGPRFEVASVKRTVASDFQRSGFIPTPGRFVAINVPAQSLIGFAHRGSFDELKNVPGWAQSERYNVTALVPAGLSQATVALMVKQLLVERFRLVAHMEQEEQDVLLLTRNQPDRPVHPGLQRIEEDCTQPRDPQAARPEIPRTEAGAIAPCLTTNNFRTLNSGGMPMEGLAGQLRTLVGRRVVDRTGLEGSYRFVLRYSRPDSGGQPTTDEYPEVTTAIREQLGLKLTPGRAPTDILVVDRFERPTDD